ncbi:hypothetical protein K3Z86_16925, partial [Pseudomonas aeruginosa]|nr:hypothetical protein [Pseudomonas aeruginosa]
MSSTPSLSHSPAELYRAWQDLRAERPQRPAPHGGGEDPTG